MGNSTASYLEINNQTQHEFTISVSGIDNFDWDGDGRPDHNFQNVKVGAGSANKQREELNAKANSAWFNMTLSFSNGDSISFRNDQRDALNGVSPRIYKIEGKYAIGQIASSAESTNRFFIYTNTDWMGRVADGTSAAALTIPGTHDSGTKNGPQKGVLDGAESFIPILGIKEVSYAIVAQLVITQDMSIKDQLKAGIRFLDIRCNNNGDNFGIQHGIYDIVDTTFNGVLQDCVDFLREHPSEIILMSLKEEGDSHNSKLGFTG